jgi:hypothetical protein
MKRVITKDFRYPVARKIVCFSVGKKNNIKVHPLTFKIIMFSFPDYRKHKVNFNRTVFFCDSSGGAKWCPS